MVEEEKVTAEVRLDTLFLYQNSITGEVSKTTHLTAKQLCRILCSASVRHITAETNVLQQLPDESYVTTWRPAKEVPVLREAAVPWYYCIKSTVTGPVKCRELRKQVKESPSSSNEICFSSALTNSEWRRMDELPSLQTALDAFDDEEGLGEQQQSQKAPVASDKTQLAEAAGHSKDVQEELEAFLSSTDHLGSKRKGRDDEDGDEAYESDNGTRYIKDPRTGNWVHEALLASAAAAKKTETAQTTSNKSVVDGNNRRKQKKAKFSAKKARCWIYVTGLPEDATEDEVATTFAKAGILDLDPETQRPKIKLYRHKDGGSTQVGKPKGDASICYARPESVQLAITLLDETAFRPPAGGRDDPAAVRMMKVQAAKFEQHGDKFDGSRGRISNAKRKVAKLATMQAMDWDDGEFNGRLTGGRKGLRIIVLKHLFRPSQFAGNSSEAEEDRMLAELERDLRIECEQWGAVEKITVFSKNREGVVVVKFTQPGAASDAVKELDGRMWRERRIEASFWDGVTDYTVRNEEEEMKESEKRLQEFGNWLERDELPEELRLKTEEHTF